MFLVFGFRHLHDVNFNISNWIASTIWNGVDQNKNIAFQGKSEYHAFGPFWGSRLGRGGFWQAANNTEAVYVISLFAKCFQPMAFSPSFDITFKLDVKMTVRGRMVGSRTCVTTRGHSISISINISISSSAHQPQHQHKRRLQKNYRPRDDSMLRRV